MKRRKVAVLAAATTALSVIPGAAAMAAGDGSTVLSNSGVVTNTPGARVLGAAPATDAMSVTLQLPMRNVARANQLVAKGTVLTPAQYRAQFGASEAQLRKVSQWAAKQGLRVTSVSADSGQVSVAGSVATVNKAFKVSMKRATLNGVRGLAVDRSPSVPSSLGLSGVAGLNTLHRMTTKNATPKLAKGLSKTASGGMKSGARGINTPNANGATDGSAACAPYWGDHLLVGGAGKKYAQQSNFLCGYQPKDLGRMYGVTSAQSKSPTIGILLWGNDPNMLSLTNSYMQSKGFPILPASNYSTVVAAPNAQMQDCGPNDVIVEQALDVQSSHAMAPNAKIQYYGAASCYDDALTASLQKMVSAHQVTTISMSFGTSSDVGMTAADKDLWDRPMRQAALTGISVFASSGDDQDNSRIQGGDGRPHVGYPASSSFVTAVGATSVGMTSTGAQPVVAAWENSYYTQPSPTSGPFVNVTASVGYDGGGGGASAVSAQPTWQKGKVTGSTTMRMVPDVSAVGNPYTAYTIRARFYDPATNTFTTSDEAIGGTSLSSPVLAAEVALAKAYNGSSIGLAAQKIYSLMGTSAIKDVNAPRVAGATLRSQSGTIYTIGFDDKPLSLQSAPGWDNATGVGTPNGWAFVTAFK
ncbi:S8/S53 family peptidase [Calidifontibacter sp. DB0510]|uniref:S8/S53 family peptidase n=1 Tax=Metallococcus carri TaxID=1656884 RepID=A0A967B2T4_9MICO|nr:S53 family peptidase [Metallococcus carri]NHN57263.1 S8/S53 family peptidase [Metallococcus carri]NOP37934.1 S8/S53 family peptidase [Calidifontibacter sp. DB2511S]